MRRAISLASAITMLHAHFSFFRTSFSGSPTTGVDNEWASLDKSNRVRMAEKTRLCPAFGPK
jgi:hypothetical protein